MSLELTFLNLFQKIKRHIPSLVIITTLFLLIGVLLTIIQPKEYRSDSRLILIQKNSTQADAYTAKRSTEASVDLLLDVIYSDDFYNKFSEGSNDIKNDFPESIDKRRKQFKNDIKIISKGNGILSIKVYNRDSVLSLKQNTRLVNVLQESAKGYIGGTDVGELKIIDFPSLYEGTGRPDIFTNMFASSLLGFVIALFYVVFKKEKKYSFLPKQ